MTAIFFKLLGKYSTYTYYANGAFFDRLVFSDRSDRKFNEFLNKYIIEEEITGYYKKNSFVTEYNDYLFIFLDRSGTRFTREQKESLLFYYTRFAQYDSPSEFLDSEVNTKKNFGSWPSSFFIMKNTNDNLIEMNKNKNKYNDFFESKEFELLSSVLPDPRYIYPKDKNGHN
ncbi:MAG: hypothetical protein FWC64_10900 [Treponema sp.]|nr:hypothetical protein [Treponema sp.]